MGRAGNNEVSCNNTMSHEKRKAIENNEIFLALLFGHFSPIINYSSSLFLDIGSVFIWFVFSSVHVYAVLTFLQNTPYGWKGEFSMLTSNKGGKYRELHVAAGGCETSYSLLDFKFTPLLSAANYLKVR